MLLAGAPAAAQTTPPSGDTAAPTAADISPPTDDADPAAIVVTGSRIARPEVDSPTPVMSYSAAAIEQSGRTNLTDFLKQNPALLGSVSTANRSATAGGPTSTAVNRLSLRNLGSNRTLTLVDGRRHVAGEPGTASVDINSIPGELIERVDITTGAASAVYGADAVSGVVNFVLKQDFEGLAARAQNGISEYGDGGSRLVSLAAGKNFADGRGNVSLAYEFRGSDRVSTLDRARTGDPLQTYGLVGNPDDRADDPGKYDRTLRNNLRWADSARDGAIDLDLDGVPDFTGSGKVYDRGLLLPSGGYTQGGDSTALAGYDGDLEASNKAHNFNLLTSFAISPSVRFFAQGKFVSTKSYTEGQPYYDFYTYLTSDNAYLNDRFGTAASENGAYMSRDHFDLGVRATESQRKTYRSVAGLDGRIGDAANFEFSYVHGRTDSVSVSKNALIADRYYAALDSVRDENGKIVCRSDLQPDAVIDANNYNKKATTFTPGANSGCKPLNLLGENVASAEAIDFVSADLEHSYRVLQHVVSASINGNLGSFLSMPGGPINYAFGGEFRFEGSRYDPDPLAQQGSLRDFSQISPEYGDFDVKEVFGEFRVPIAKDARFLETLELNAALRVSDYSTVGLTTTWQVSGIWAPIRDVRFRGTYSRAVRAPNISELYGPKSGDSAFITDPCDPTEIAKGTQYRAANCQTTLKAAGLSAEQIANFDAVNDPVNTSNIAGTSGGNRDLKEETATTWTAGVVVQPSFLPGLMVAVDWYNIYIADAINTADVQTLVELCVDQPTLDNVYCENITRSSKNGYINGFYVAPQNVASYRTQGLDFQANYLLQGGSLGLFNLKLVGSYLDRLDYVPTPGATRENDLLSSSSPKYSGTFDITWTTGPITLNYGLAYTSKTRRYSEETLRANPDRSDPKYFFYREKWEHDLQASLAVGKDYSFYFGVNNLTNQQGDVASTSTPYSYVGRTFYAGARLRMPGI